MNPGELNIWLDIVIQVLALFAAIVGGLWACTKFIIQSRAFALRDKGDVSI